MRQDLALAGVAPVFIFANNVRSAQAVADAFQMRPGGWLPAVPDGFGRHKSVILVVETLARVQRVEELDAITKAMQGGDLRGRDVQILEFSLARYTGRP